MDSGSNNIKDISLLLQFSCVCGFTISEFDALFKDRMPQTLESLKAKGQISLKDNEEILRQKILQWYDGYNWLGLERVLKPYSILNFFSDCSLTAYWPLSGQPSHLKTLIQERPMDFIRPKLDGYTSKSIRKVELGCLEAIAVLFHSG
jgi:hypothetical protein